jgi:hypothetical protein
MTARVRAAGWAAFGLSTAAGLFFGAACAGSGGRLTGFHITVAVAAGALFVAALACATVVGLFGTGHAEWVDDDMDVELQTRAGEDVSARVLADAQ